MNKRRQVSAFIAIVLVCGAAVACERSDNAPGGPAPEKSAVDSARLGSAAEVTSWRHRRTFEADLDGDADKERVVLASDVELGPNGVPLWEDGHRWTVFVDDKPEVTLLYGAFVPNGLVEAAVVTADANGHRNVLIQERTPDQTRSFVVSYEKPGVARTVAETHYQIEQWLPGLTDQ
jgi:hypothetical protein